ncbi:MAG: YceD family protein [Oscillochloridaceae bacterium umkhey_bin13]
MTDLKFNLAQLLREEMGSRRDYQFTEDVLPLDDQLQMREISGNVRFTRTATGVWAKVQAQGVVRLTCVRSLDEFDETITVEFADQFHSVIDVFSGGTLPQPVEEDPFFLNELHMADIGEALREYTLLTLPLNPVSPAHRDQPISYTVQSDGIEDEDEPDGVADPAASLEALKAWADRHNKRNGRS